MKPVDQTKLHDPDNGINGNCMAASLASILELSLSEVPEFEDMGEQKWWPALRRWLKSLGYHLLAWKQEFYMPVYFIASGPSPRGIEHSVVYRGTKMVHDPHPSRAGIVEITSVWALLPIDPVQGNKYEFQQRL